MFNVLSFKHIDNFSDKIESDLERAGPDPTRTLALASRKRMKSVETVKRTSKMMARRRTRRTRRRFRRKPKMKTLIG